MRQGVRLEPLLQAINNLNRQLQGERTPVCRRACGARAA
jgi:hypothetical protein